MPKLTKKIIYLDQFAVSKMMTAIHPAEVSKSARVAHFRNLFTLLSELCQYQAIVCPSSEAHIHESLLASSPQAHQQVFELLSGDCKFRPFSEIASLQLAALADRWGIGNSEPIDLRITDALTGPHDGWTSRLFATVPLARTPQYVKLMKDDKTANARDFLAVWERWKEDRSATFEDTYRFEASCYGPCLLDSVASHAAEWAMKVEPTVLRLQRVLGLGKREEAVSKSCEFLATGDLTGAPVVQIQSLLFAALKRKAAVGQKRPPSDGMLTDVTLLAHLLPYCDAMLIDNECHSLLNEEPLRGRLERFRTRLFCSRTLDEFTAYLRDLKRGLTRSHKQRVHRIYGKPEPFWGLLQTDTTDFGDGAKWTPE